MLMEEYLEWISALMHNNPCAVILDVNTSHLAEEVQKKAKKLNIELIYVPAGCTD